MGSLAAYSFKSALLLSVLAAIYMITLGRLKAASMRRFTLLGISIASLILPWYYLFGYRTDIYNRIVDLTLPTPTVTITEISISPIYSIIAIIIAAGVLVATVLTIVGLTRIMMLRTRTVYNGDYRLKVTAKRLASPFCFCGNIYISETDFIQMPEMILLHENSHISHLHFIDLLIGRILLILQWWNPMAWLFVKELQMVHEYQADSDVLKTGYDCKEYQCLLLSRAKGGPRYNLVSGFRNNELKSRLKMINTEKAGWKKGIALLLMLIPASIVTLALPGSTVTLLINDKFSVISLESLSKTPAEATVSKLDGTPQIIVNGTPVPYETSVSNLNTDVIRSITVRKDQPEYPYGVIEIETLPGVDISDINSSQEPEEIKVLGYGTINKQQ